MALHISPHRSLEDLLTPGMHILMAGKRYLGYGVIRGLELARLRTSRSSKLGQSVGVSIHPND